MASAGQKRPRDSDPSEFELDDPNACSSFRVPNTSSESSSSEYSFPCDDTASSENLFIITGNVQDDVFTEEAEDVDEGEENDDSELRSSGNVQDEEKSTSIDNKAISVCLKIGHKPTECLCIEYYWYFIGDDQGTDWEQAPRNVYYRFPFVDTFINGTYVRAFLDTGSKANLIDINIARRIGLNTVDTKDKKLYLLYGYPDI